MINRTTDTLPGNAVQVAASIGTMCSSASIGASDIYRYSETPQVSYAATSPSLSDKLQYPYFSRTVPPDDQQAQALLAFLQHSGVTRAGAISFDDAYTSGITNAFRDFAPTFGVDVPNLAKVQLGFLTNSMHEGVKQVHGDLTIVCRLRDMHALGIKHTLIALQTRGDLMYFVSAIQQTGYLKDTQLYYTYAVFFHPTHHHHHHHHHYHAQQQDRVGRLQLQHSHTDH